MSTSPPAVRLSGRFIAQQVTPLVDPHDRNSGTGAAGLRNAGRRWCSATRRRGKSSTARWRDPSGGGRRRRRAGERRRSKCGRWRSSSGISLPMALRRDPSPSSWERIQLLLPTMLQKARRVDLSAGSRLTSTAKILASEYGVVPSTLPWQETGGRVGSRSASHFALPGS